MITIDTRTQAEQHIITSIEAGDATRDEFDIEAIADSLYDIAGGTWDIQHIDHDMFWAVVAEHAL